MKILVFGVTGLVGTELELASEHYPIELVGVSHVDVELSDYESVRAIIFNERPDSVVNLVAIPSINPCEENPDLAFSLHVTAPLHMIKACAELDSVYVQASSHAVFDGTKEEPYTENDIPNPTNVYGVSKFASEVLSANLCQRHYVIRLATMYGRRRNRSLGFVDKMLELMQNRGELKVADDKIDSPTYAKDVAQSLLKLLTEAPDYGIYHLANSGFVSYFDFVCSLRDQLGIECEIFRAKDSDFPALGLKPLRTALSSVRLKPMRPWEEALAEYVETTMMSGR